MLKQQSMWVAFLCLVPACWCAGQAAPDIVPQHRWVSAVENHVWKSSEYQVQTVTGMHHSSLTANPFRGWSVSEAAEVSRGRDSNPLTYLSSPSDTFTRFSGTLGFRRSRSTGELDMSYTGGGVRYSRLDTFNQTFHRARLDDTIFRPRWTIVSSAEFKYLPDAPLFVFGTGGNVPQNLLASDLVLLGNNEPFYSGLGMMDVTHGLTPRSSMTASFSYGVLRFVNGGYEGNTSYSYSLGYNHQLTRNQTLGIRYADQRFDFQNSPATVVSRSPAVVLEKTVLNRFLAHVEGGPEAYSISGAPYSGLTRWTWALDTGMEYTVHKSTVSLNYTHGTSSGSGLLVGSELHSATGRLEQRFSDHWSASAEGSWAHGVAITPSPAGLSDLTVVMSGAEIDRRLFATESLYFRYTYATENRPPSCTEASCAVGINREVMEVGLRLSHSSAHESHPQGN